MRPHVVAGAVTTLLLSISVAVPIASAENKGGGPSIALFEGRLIDLRDGWGEATACTSDNITTECFRTEAERDGYIAEESALISRASDDFAILATCSTTLKLYANTSFGGSSLALSTRGSFLNLSTFGFDNVTSSYQVGACASTFYDGASGGTPVYPGNTSAGASATSMLSGWDNRISSVFIS